MPRRHLRRNPRRTHVGALAAALAVTVSSVAVSPVAVPVAEAADALVARQGERVFVDNMGGYNLTSCTIGYNDLSQRRSYTAGHCAVHDTVNDTASSRGGSTVYLADESGNQLPTPAGLIYPAAAYYGPANANDWSVIYWFNNVTVGQNTYGGAYVPISEISPGDTLCYHGYASHGRSTAAACGPFVGMIEKTIYFDAPGTPHYGDSGGPLYAPGRGVVGVMSGANALVDEDDNEVVGLERASSLQSGPLYGEARIDAFLREYYARQFQAPAETSASGRPPATLKNVTPTSATRLASSPSSSTRVTPSSAAAPATRVTAQPPTTATAAPSTTSTTSTAATRSAAPVPTGAATPSIVPSEAPVDPAKVEQRRDRRIADALLITLGVVAAAAVLVPAIGYALGLIR